MRLRSSLLAFAAVAAAFCGTLLPGSGAFAQAKEQFFPVLSYRTGAYAPNGAE